MVFQYKISFCTSHEHWKYLFNADNFAALVTAEECREDPFVKEVLKINLYNENPALINKIIQKLPAQGKANKAEEGKAAQAKNKKAQKNKKNISAYINFLKEINRPNIALFMNKKLKSEDRLEKKKGFLIKDVPRLVSIKVDKVSLNKLATNFMEFFNPPTESSSWEIFLETEAAAAEAEAAEAAAEAAEAAEAMRTAEYTVEELIKDLHYSQPLTKNNFKDALELILRVSQTEEDKSKAYKASSTFAGTLINIIDKLSSENDEFNGGCELVKSFLQGITPEEKEHFCFTILDTLPYYEKFEAEAGAEAEAEAGAEAETEKMKKTVFFQFFNQCHTDKDIKQLRFLVNNSISSLSANRVVLLLTKLAKLEKQFVIPDQGALCGVDITGSLNLNKPLSHQQITALREFFRDDFPKLNTLRLHCFENPCELTPQNSKRNEQFPADAFSKDFIYPIAMLEMLADLHPEALKGKTIIIGHTAQIGQLKEEQYEQVKYLIIKICNNGAKIEFNMNHASNAFLFPEGYDYSKSYVRVEKIINCCPGPEGTAIICHGWDGRAMLPNDLLEELQTKHQEHQEHQARKQKQAKHIERLSAQTKGKRGKKGRYTKSIKKVLLRYLQEEFKRDFGSA